MLPSALAATVTPTSVAPNTAPVPKRIRPAPRLFSAGSACWSPRSCLRHNRCHADTVDSKANRAGTRLASETIAGSSVEVGGDELTISGEVKEREGVFRRRTRRTGRFDYGVTLPTDVDPQKIEAVMRDSVLSVRVPNSAESRPR